MEHKAAIYVRLSKDDGSINLESESITNQKNLLHQYASEHEFSVVHTYIDDGFSGTNQDRPALKQMLADVVSGKINIVLVKDLSRLGRNYLEVGNLAEVFFPSHGCKLISITEQIDDLLAFRNWFNEHYSRETSKKVKAVKKMLATSGKFLGTYAAYGYKKSSSDKYKLIIDEQTKGVVIKIFELRASGASYTEIANCLNEQKIISPRSYYYQTKRKSNIETEWNVSTISQMLKNEVYRGNMVQMKKGTKTYKTRKLTKKPVSEWVRVLNTHEPIISEELWKRVQEIADSKLRTRKKKNGEVSLFSGLLKCGSCGRTMRNQTENGVLKSGEAYRYSSFICSGYSKQGKAFCSPHIIYENALLKIVTETLQVETKKVRLDKNRINQRLGEDHNRLQASYQFQLENANLKLQKIKKMVPKIYEDYHNQLLPENLFRGLLEQYATKQMETEKTCQELAIKLAKNLENKMHPEFVFQMADFISLVKQIEIGERTTREGQTIRQIKITFKMEHPSLIKATLD